MSRTHYEVLGVKQGCSPDEIRSAYRKLVLKFHPDRSKDSRATDIFIAITESYEVLNDAGRRRDYDRLLAMERMQTARPQPAAAPRTTTVKPPTHAQVRMTPGGTPRSATLTVDLTRLSVLFSRGQYGEAEKLAKRLRQNYPRQPLPYAVLADIARSRGEIKEATKLYAYAIQMDPTNEHYRLRYEELVRSEPVKPKASHASHAGVEIAAPLVGIAVVVLACVYLALSQEPPIFGSLPFVGTWTLGLVVMTFLCGVVIGACLTVGGHLDRFQASVVTTLGKISPNVALAFVAVVNFWVACAIYVVMGLTQKGFNYTTSRLVSSVGGSTVLLAFAASLSQGARFYGGVDFWQAAVWGGNLMYVGALFGWMAADSLRKG